MSFRPPHPTLQLTREIGTGDDSELGRLSGAGVRAVVDDVKSAMAPTTMSDWPSWASQILGEQLPGGTIHRVRAVNSYAEESFGGFLITPVEAGPRRSITSTSLVYRRRQRYCRSTLGWRERTTSRPADSVSWCGAIRATADASVAECMSAPSKRAETRRHIGSSPVTSSMTRRRQSRCGTRNRSAATVFSCRATPGSPADSSHGRQPGWPISTRVRGVGSGTGVGPPSPQMTAICSGSSTGPTETWRCCTARSKSLTSLCRLQSHPAQYVSGIPSAAILLSISHPIRCSTRCLANVRARISGPMIAL